MIVRTNAFIIMFSHLRSFLLSVLLPALTLSSMAFGDDEAEPEPWEKELEELEREAEELERELEAFLDPETPAWMGLFSLQGGLGHNDNVLQSSVSRDGSFFLFTGFDFMLRNTPASGDPEFNLFLFAENEHFFSNGDFNDQRLVSLHAEAVFEPAPDWELALPWDVNYYDEFVDVSTREVDLDTVRFRGVGVHFEPALRYGLAEAHELEGKVIGRKVFLRDPLDDYREIGVGASWEFVPAPATTLLAEARSVHRRYASREALEADGTPIEGRRREFLIHRLDGTVKHFWDTDRAWESRLSAGLEINRDNGDGYFDFLRPLFSHRLVYRRAPWRVVAGTRVSHYDYDVRTLDDNTGGNLRRTFVDAELRGEFTMSDNLRLFAEYRHDTVLTNETGAAYRVNKTLAGAEWTF